jgi:hypothetical protein
VSKSDSRLFPAEIATWQARARAADLLGATGTPISTGTTLRQLGAACPALTDPQLPQFSTLVREVFDSTIRFLPASDLEGVWIRPTWLACKQLPADFSRAFSMLEAYAKRDYPNMEGLGRSWLEKKPTASYLRRDFDAIAMSAVLLGLAHETNWSQLVQTYREFGADVAVSDEYSTQFRLLEALAASEIATANGLR